jgi:flagellar assembly factor FliW
MPLGLLGLERVKEYVLQADPTEDPFLWLQAKHDPTLAFVVVPPQPLFPDYLPDISAEDAAFLGASSSEDLRLLCIVTLRDANRATVNLKGPVVVHRRTWLAKQVIPVNAARFSVQHPLPVAQS